MDEFKFSEFIITPDIFNEDKLINLILISPVNILFLISIFSEKQKICDSDKLILIVLMSILFTLVIFKYRIYR